MNPARLKLVKGDITKEKVDAIVNATTENLAGRWWHRWVYSLAGGPDVAQACNDIRARQLGWLPHHPSCRHERGRPSGRICHIHTVGPIWRGGTENEPDLFASCYRESLFLARECGVMTIAFPSISTGIYRYPIDEASVIAHSTVKEFVETYEGIQEVRFVLFDDVAYDCFAEFFSYMDI